MTKLEAAALTALTDDSMMTFGKHKGLKLKDVPHKYLMYLYDNGIQGPIRNYIDGLFLEAEMAGGDLRSDD